MVEGLHNCTPEAVHNGQPFSHKDEEHAAHEYTSQHHFVDHANLVHLFLEGPREDVEGEKYLEDESCDPAEEDD